MGPYKSGDVVWVLASKRLGWWPACVQNMENLPSDLREDVTDDTIAVVKYLNEENYQFIVEPGDICAYDSEKKEEHVALGIKKYNEKKRLNEVSSAFMKFPDSVTRAQKLTGGRIDLVEDERFQPKKIAAPQSKYKSIFIDPRTKESNRGKSPLKSGSPKTQHTTVSSARDLSKKQIASPSTSKINHPRFLGQSDHEVRIRKQESSPTASICTTNSSGTPSYTCDVCAFQTTRLNVMILHKKTHLNANAAVTDNGESKRTKTGQKRSGSLVRKTPKRRKTSAQEVEEEANGSDPGDLFDQVKRNLEAKEGNSTTANSGTAPESKKSIKNSGKTHVKAKPVPRTPKAAASPRSPKTPKVPAKSIVKSPKTVVSKPSPNNDTANKAQLNPKKKWLKSSLQSKAESNPEVKIKLMADWEEDDSEEAHKKEQRTQASLPTPLEEVQQRESDSSDQDLPSKSSLLKQRSDDEDDGDAERDMDVDDKRSQAEEHCNISSAQEIHPEEPSSRTQKDAAESSAAAKSNESEPNPEESLAGISAEIDKLTADLDAGSNMTASQESRLNGDSNPKQNGLADDEVATDPMKSEDEIKQDVANLLAETSVPVIPDLVNVKSNNIANMEIVDGQVESAHEAEVVTDQECLQAQELTVADGESVVQTVVEQGNGNILMQVEGGETYMVVWEPGSNIQEFLAEGVEVDGEGSGTRTLLIDPSSLQGAGSDLENLFQIAVAAAAPGPPPNEQSNST